MGMKPRKTLRQRVAELESEKSILIHKQYVIRETWFAEKKMLLSTIDKLERQLLGERGPRTAY